MTTEPAPRPAPRGQPGDAGPHRAAVSIDPGPGSQVDCTCIWTPAPGATPQATAGTILAVFAAISPAHPGQDP